MRATERTLNDLNNIIKNTDAIDVIGLGINPYFKINPDRIINEFYSKNKTIRIINSNDILSFLASNNEYGDALYLSRVSEHFHNIIDVLYMVHLKYNKVIHVVPDMKSIYEKMCKHLENLIFIDDYIRFLNFDIIGGGENNEDFHHSFISKDIVKNIFSQYFKIKINNSIKINNRDHIVMESSKNDIVAKNDNIILSLYDIIQPKIEIYYNNTISNKIKINKYENIIDVIKSNSGCAFSFYNIISSFENPTFNLWEINQYLINVDYKYHEFIEINDDYIIKQFDKCNTIDEYYFYNNLMFHEFKNFIMNEKIMELFLNQETVFKTICKNNKIINHHYDYDVISYSVEIN